MLRGVARAVTRAAVRAPAAWARAPVSEHRRAMSLMVSQNFAKTVAQKAATEPHVDAVKMHTDDAEPVRWTHQQLQSQASAFGMGLTEVMYTPGSKIVVWTKDITEGIVAQLGALRVGVNVTVLGSESTADDLRKAMVGARGLLFSPTVQPNEAALNIVREVIPESSVNAEWGAHKVIASEEFPDLRFVYTTGFYRRDGHMVKFSQLLSYDPVEILPTVSLGKIEFAGKGSPVAMDKLPYFDPTVTLTPDAELFED